MKALLYSAAAALLALPAAADDLDLPILPREHWWTGVIAEAHLMPFTAESNYKLNFYGDTAGNQGQPLLISDHGRFIWCDEPFQFRIEGGAIRAVSEHSPLVSGTEGSTLREAYRHVSRRFFPAAGRLPHEELFVHPQYNTWIELTYNQNQKDVLGYARSIRKNGFPAGVLMIDEGWARNYGNWDFDRARFPDAKQMMRELHALGFKVMLWVCPYISPDGPFFKDLSLDRTSKGRTVWFVNADKPEQPALVEWWDGFSAIVDLTNPDGARWFKGQLDRLVTEYGVDGFKFDGGDASYYTPGAMLMRPKAAQDLTPNGHTETFNRLGLDYPLNEFRATWKMGGQPLAQRLRDKNHSWEDLRKLIPGILDQGIMGYAFTCPDLIGGGEYLSFLNQKTLDPELIVRAAQIHALMPMMQFSVAPWRVLSPANLELVLRAAKLHDSLGPEILALAKEAARTGEPIARSLEYEHPGNGYASVADEFLLGSSILVAPVVQKGATERPVLFPPGTWKGDDGNVVKGPAMEVVKAPLARLPWYRRVDAAVAR
ncbi:MAG: glycoside hydrolase family 31 protein [Bryobacteraceae bacterium]